ncbi:hypothetical protein [Chromobacterium subtsugae]|uniref:hypothetical protein n=1 Tax=Chromobacterium subtsugae TaxID=251747 RepID=UPI00064141C7|nr:hypothetical protein [Chromobacterium subtsugae]
MTDARRILIVGCSCSGKTTFAGKLSRATGIPAADLDPLYWGPGWTPRPAETFLQSVRHAADQPNWIISGNYSAARHLLWTRATDIIWLDYDFPLVFFRAIRRTLGRCISRRELWNGNRESFRQSFLSRDSILRWVASSHGRLRADFGRAKAQTDYPQLRWRHFRSPAEAERFLRQAAV